MRVHQKLAHRCLTSSHGPTNPPSSVQIQENAMKRKEGNCTGKRAYDGTNGEKVHRKTYEHVKCIFVDFNLSGCNSDKWLRLNYFKNDSPTSKNVPRTPCFKQQSTVTF